MKLTTGSLRSQDEVPSKTGKAAPASAGSLFPLEGIADTAAVEKILSQFSSLPAKVVLALAVAHILSRSVTPQRLCACGCGAFVTGKAKTNGPACRKRLERERRRNAGPPGRQFNLVLQDEMPFKVPTVTDQAADPSGENAAGGTKFPWTDCDHSGFYSLANECCGFYCCQCKNLILSDIPAPPEMIGYLSAAWKDWETDHADRYPNKVRSQFAKLPLRDEEKDCGCEPMTPSKLTLIRDLAQLGKTAEQISSATGCSAEMVAAYMKHLAATPPS